MHDAISAAQYQVGLNIPAAVGMPEEEISTPALIIDLDAFEGNVAFLRDYCRKRGVRLRPHAKTHKSLDIAKYQMREGGAVGICCQKVSEAEVFVSGGIGDVLVSNQVVDPRQIDLLARLAAKAKMGVCVDDPGNVESLSQAAVGHGVTLSCLVEIDVGMARCGVPWGQPAVDLAHKIAAAPGLEFGGLQAYHGSAQHVLDYEGRKAAVQKAISQTAQTVKLLKAEGLKCGTVGGAGTGTYYFEAESGVFNELQCGSYIFMDAEYRRVQNAGGDLMPEFKSSLFIYTTIMSTAASQGAVCDAGLKSLTIGPGLPRVHGREDIEFVKCSDEHGQISDPLKSLRLNEKIKLVPWHCDPTCNMHDWLVGVRNGRVECLWPVSARGRVF